MICRVRSSATVALALILCAGAGRAAVVWPEMSGSWPGIRQSGFVPAVQLPAVRFTITRQREAQFAGSLDVRFVCEGAVQPVPPRAGHLETLMPGFGSVVNIRGLSTDGRWRLSMHGMTQPVADDSIQVAALRYQVTGSRDSVLDQGYLLLLQRSGGSNGTSPVPNVSGAYEGVFRSLLAPDGGRITGALSAIPTEGVTVNRFAPSGGFAGDVGCKPKPEPSGPVPIPYPIVSSVQGSVGPLAAQLPGSDLLASPLVMFGEAAGAAPGQSGPVIILSGRFLPAVQRRDVTRPQQIQGSFVLYGSLAEVFEALWSGRDSRLDSGEFVMSGLELQE